MAESKELKKIKKKYGEDFMKLCRELFPTILEQEGILYQLLDSTFAGNSRTLYKDIVENNLEEEFKNLIYSKVDVEQEEITVIEERTPYEILDEAGYNLYECTTEEEIESFKKYYAPGEELCTFRENRLSRYVVFWAVKKDVENIRREDFKNPKREDEYGTSVMSIQFRKKGRCTVSIKNRYNITVENPDATYGNDLDRIAPNLSQSFGKLLKERGLELYTSNKEKFNIPKYVVGPDGKYYKYNQEINGKYYCPGNVVIGDGEVKKFDPRNTILLDYFVLDLQNKKIQLLDDRIEDSFIDGLQNIEKIEVKKNKENKTRTIEIKVEEHEEPAIIEIDEDNQIIGYKNNWLKECGDNFLVNNVKLKDLTLPKLEKCGNCFLRKNKGLKKLILQNLKKCGDEFLRINIELEELILQNLEECGDDFLFSNGKLEELTLSKLEKCGNGFLYLNNKLKKLTLLNLKECGNDFLRLNRVLKELILPNLKKYGSCFLENNRELKKQILRKVRRKKISPRDIVKLDKKNEITSSEIKPIRTRAKKILDKFSLKDRQS